MAEGFARLYARVAEVEQTDDPLADLVASAAAYRAHALADPHLFSVMFGSASLGEYRLHRARSSRSAWPRSASWSAIVARVMDAGAIRRGDPAAVAGQFWAALHGYVMIELSGLSHVVEDPEGEILQPLLANLLTALAP